MSIGELLSNVPWWVWVVHALLIPVYQIIGTLKHEAGHALGAAIDGRGITKFVFWPQIDLGRFTWGYVMYGYGVLSIPWYVHLMPYFFDTVWFAVGLAIIASIGLAGAHAFWVLFALAVVVLIPVIDLFWNLVHWAWSDQGDFAQAFMKES